MSEPQARLDDAWLREVFHRAGQGGEKASLVSALAVGQGNTSHVMRLTLSQGQTLIAKLPLELNGATASPGDIFGYGRELSAYRFFGASPAFRIPHCHVADGDADDFTLILEDLGADARPGNEIAGCRIEDAHAVIAELGALHCAYWRSPAIAELDWPSRRWLHAEATAGRFAKGAAVMHERYGEHIDAAALALIDAAVPLIRDWASTVPFAPTLIHADPRVDNIIFEANGRACLIDLQSISVGDAAFDLAYFLGGSLAPGDRAACERALVPAHAAMIRSVEPAYDDETAWHRYRQFLLSGLVATVSAAGVLGDKACVPQIVALARRNCAAITALDGLAAARERIAEGRERKHG